MIDAADIESHDPVELFYEDNNWDNSNKRWNEPIADNPEFADSIMNRVKNVSTGTKTVPVSLSGQWETKVHMAVTLKPHSNGQRHWSVLSLLFISIICNFATCITYQIISST